MVGTPRLATADTDNFKDELKSAGSCDQVIASGSSSDQLHLLSLTSLVNLEDQTHQRVRASSHPDADSVFQPWTLDAFLVLSVESFLFAPDRESIYEAAEAGDATSVNAFLDAGINVEAKRDGDGLTPLLVAARFGQQEVCDTLLQRGADVSSTANSLSTPLHEAARNGRAVCCQLLLAAGSNPNSKDASGQTPLHLASLGGHLSTVRLLLAAGASHSVTTALDDTPLHLAVDGGHNTVCRILMQHGALPRQVSPKRKFSFSSPVLCSSTSKKNFVNSNKAISSY